MAVGSAGSLVVSLGLNAAEFVAGLTKSEYQAQKFARSISNDIAIGVVKAEIALRALGQAASIAIRAFPELIQQAGHFQDLAEKTGASAEALASFSIAAQVAGTSVDDVATFTVKLSKNLVSVDEDASKTALALTALGIPIKAFKALDPAAQIDALSKALAKFNDIGGGKAAVLENIAKGGAQLLPFLKELEESGGRQITLTAEQIKKADEFSDSTARSKAQINAFAQVVAVEASGAVAGLTKALKDTIQELLGLDNEGKKLRDDNSIEDFANNAARALAFIIDSADSVGRIFNITGTVIGAAAAQVGALADSRFTGDIEESLRRYNAIQEDASQIIDGIIQKQTVRFRLEKNITDNAARAAFVGPPPPDRPTLPIPTARKTGAADDPTKKILDGQIKALEDSIARERDLLQSRETLIQASFNAGYLSIKDSFDRTQEARDEALRNTLAYYEKEIALQQAFAAKSTTSQVNRADALNKIADYRAKEAKANADAITQAQQLAIVRESADRRYAQDLDELNAKMLDLAGNTAKAAAIRFDAATSALRGEAQSRGDTATLSKIAAIKETEQVQKKLTEETNKYQLILGDIAISQGYINLAQSTGAISEIDALNQTSALNKSKLADLQAQLAAYEKIANSPFATDEQIQQAKRMKLEIEQIAAATDLLADKFNKTFGDAFATAISDVATGAKSVKDAFNDMAKSITKSIADMAAQDIASKLFGKGGGLTGIGDMLAKLFGSNGSTITAGADAIDTASAVNDASKTIEAATELGASAIGMTTASTGLLTAGTALVTAATALTTAATALASAAGGSAAGGIGGLAGLFGKSGGAGIGYGEAGSAIPIGPYPYANGTDSARGGWSMVGERGPELMNIPRGAQIISNDVLRQRRITNITVNTHVMPGATTSSARQSAAMVREAVSRSARDR